MTGRDLNDEEGPAGQGMEEAAPGRGNRAALEERKGKRAGGDVTARQAPEDVALSKPRQQTWVSFYFQEKPLESFIQGHDMI